MGEHVTVWLYVDANHAGNLAIRTSHSGILIYVKKVLIKFYIKIQNKVESSIFGSEFVALRINTEMVEALRYTLRKFVVNLEGPAEVYCYKKLVVKISSVTA